MEEFSIKNLSEIVVGEANIGLEGFEEFGQHESLTNRLNKILKVSIAYLKNYYFIPKNAKIDYTWKIIIDHHTIQQIAIPFIIIIIIIKKKSFF